MTRTVSGAGFGPKEVASQPTMLPVSPLKIQRAKQRTQMISIICDDAVDDADRKS